MIYHCGYISYNRYTMVVRGVDNGEAMHAWDKEYGTSS